MNLTSCIMVYKQCNSYVDNRQRYLRFGRYCCDRFNKISHCRSSKAFLYLFERVKLINKGAGTQMLYMCVEFFSYYATVVLWLIASESHSPSKHLCST